MGHSPYSPDIAPNEFSLLPHIMKQMRGQPFSSPEDAVEAFKNHVLELSQSECIDKWFERMQKYINYAEEYFEKQ